MKEAKLKLSTMKCLVCKQVLISSHTHDFRTCDCGNLSLDGGNDYQRVLFKDKDLIEDLSLIEIDGKLYQNKDQPKKE